MCVSVSVSFAQGPVHECAVMFVDNSGVDFVLGMLPFARELLSRGTKVIVCANKEPSLNDITIYELDAVLRKCCDSIIKHAYDTKQLLIYANGQNSCCLDLRRISPGEQTIFEVLSIVQSYQSSLSLSIRTMRSDRYGTCGFIDHRGNGTCLTHQFKCKIQLRIAEIGRGEE